MKFGNFLLKAFGAFMLVFFVQNLVKAQEGNGVIVPMKNNWGTHEMGTTPEGQMCVELDEDNVLRLSIYLNTATNEVESELPMHIFYTLVEPNISVMTPAITKSDFHLVNGTNFNYYQYKLNINYDFSGTCLRGNDPGVFTIMYQLFAQTEGCQSGCTPYPMQNQVLWPTNMFGQQPASCPPVYESKRICCHTDDRQGLAMLDDETTDIAEGETLQPGLSIEMPSNSQNEVNRFMTAAGADNKLQVTPNPFKDDITVQFVGEEPGQLKLECFNAEGKLMKSVLGTTEFAGPQSIPFDLTSIPAGLYYLRVSTTSWTKTVKVVKSID